MNLIECYIKEVISERDCTEEWENYMRTKGGKPEYKSPEPFLEVVCKENCYGGESVRQHNWMKSEWEKIKKQGFYFG